MIDRDPSEGFETEPVGDWPGWVFGLFAVLLSGLVVELVLVFVALLHR